MTAKRTLNLLTLLPPAAIQTDILQFKKDIERRFGAVHAQKLPAHITLQRPFWVEKNKAQSLKDALTQIAAPFPFFEVRLKDFGCFPPRVIYVHIDNDAAVRDLHAHLAENLSISLFHKPDEKQLQITPHITLATRDLPEHSFEAAWKLFKDRKYTATFTAEAISLFQHDGKVWNLVETYAFKSTN